MAVKITDILDPKTFWAHETENVGREEKMKGIQKEMQLQWLNSQEIEKMDATEGLRVIVLINKELFRGEIIGVWTENHKMKAKVFLLDYGSTIDRVDMTTNVRHLKPTKELSQDPLAFKIILAGLYPVSMDIDWDLPSEVSMQQSRKRYWDGSAMKLVKRVVGLCNGLGILRDASSPSSTRRVGTLIMCKTSSSRDQINLNKLLEDKKFADYSQFEVEMDHNSVDQGYGVESTDFSSDEEDVVIRNSDPLLNVPHMTIQQKIANHYRERNNNDDSFSSTDSSKAGPSLRARKSLQKKGAEGNVADQLKESLRSVSDEVTKKEEAQEEVQEEDDIWSKFREEKKEVKGHMIPGGVFLGKRHENILARIKSSNEQELREKFTKLVTKK